MNHENFKLVLDTIKARPEGWNQWYWHSKEDCLTTHCFAGWAQLLGTGQQTQCAYDDAMAWLELTEGQCEYLFDGDRTLKDFEQFYAAHAPKVEAELVEA